VVTIGPRTAEGSASALVPVGRIYRIAVIVFVGVFFLIPIVASARYSFLGNNHSLTLGAYTSLFSTPEFWRTLWLSVRIGLGTVALTLVLLVPTVVWIDLRFPRARRIFEALSLLPLVIPSVVVSLGVITSFKSFPNFFTGTPIILAFVYVVLALPYTYRTLDSAFSALDLKTLVEASSSLGAPGRTTLRSVLMPNARSGILGAALLAFAFSMGEFVVASLLGFNTLPVYLLLVGQTEASQAVALSLIALVFTWIPLAATMIIFGKKRRKRTTVLEEEV